VNKIFIILIGILVGFIYYINIKNSIKKHYKNCSFVENKETYISFLSGVILIYLGFFKYDDNILIIIGIY
jgi:hypothetical protein